MHFYPDHDWMTELGEGLPVYRPPLNMAALFAEPAPGTVSDGSAGQVEGLTVRYLTPHNKWSIHSEYRDNLFMLSLSRGGQNIWMSDRDAAKVGIKDNDWIEAVNLQRRRRGRGDRLPPHARRNGVHVPRTGPADRRTARRDVRQARRHPQLPDAAAREAVPPDRGLCPADLRLQLSRPHR
uniref:Uncharacterized protein n=1 Tax=Janibacter limosus TaxID=53458 RepID=A0AC61U3R3_9MICO